VAEYIHQAFYSQEAQVRNHPVRQTLLRRTQQQHRNSIADLIGSFRPHLSSMTEEGLTASVRNRRKKGRRTIHLPQGTAPYFDADVASSIDDLHLQGFRITWEGALTPPETGTYQFKLRTPNGARLFLNEYGGESLGIIDLGVSSNNEMREKTGSLFLLGGYSVPISVDFRTFKEKDHFLLLEWKPPHGTWEQVPARYFSRNSGYRSAIIDTSFPPDDASLGYERGSSVSKAWNQAVAKAAIQASKLVLDDLGKLAGIEEDQDEDRTEKLEQFCERFASRAFGRPLTLEQKRNYIDSLFDQHSPEEAVKRSVMLTLTSPFFLYPRLNGRGDSHDIAKHLALTLWDSIPDRSLREAAAQGQLHKPEQLRKQIDRMLDDKRTKQKIQRFYFQWLALAEKEDLSKDPETYPKFDKRHIADLRESLITFLHNVTWSKESDFRWLFSEQRLFLNPRLAKFYDAKHPGGSGFERIQTPDESRSGVFTHPYLLAAFSYNKQTSPIHRGVYLGRNVLGLPTPSSSKIQISTLI